jgi:hypothetical protein
MCQRGIAEPSKWGLVPPDGIQKFNTTQFLKKMIFQNRTLPQIIRLKTNRYQADGSSFYRLLLHFIVWDSTEFIIMIEYLRSARSFIQYHLTPVRSVHHPNVNYIFVALNILFSYIYFTIFYYLTKTKLYNR